MSPKRLAAADSAYPKDINARVRHVRGVRGLTQAELADLSGVSRRQVVEIEAGRANPTVKTIASLCHALGVAPEDLGFPRGLLGPTARRVARELQVDLLPGRRAPAARSPR